MRYHRGFTDIQENFPPELVPECDLVEPPMKDSSQSHFDPLTTRRIIYSLKQNPQHHIVPGETPSSAILLTLSMVMASQSAKQQSRTICPHTFACM